jgi:hypothetical protein
MIVVDNYKETIRKRREKECFPIINRGFLWYERLSREQLNELEEWYQAWLDAPETRIIPALPIWVNQKTIKETEEILI